jgi:hypothetical protein
VRQLQRQGAAPARAAADKGGRAGLPYGRSHANTRRRAVMAPPSARQQPSHGCMAPPHRRPALQPRRKTSAPIPRLIRSYLMRTIGAAARARVGATATPPRTGAPGSSCILNGTCKTRSSGEPGDCVGERGGSLLEQQSSFRGDAAAHRRASIAFHLLRSEVFASCCDLRRGARGRAANEQPPTPRRALLRFDPNAQPARDSSGGGGGSGGGSLLTLRRLMAFSRRFVRNVRASQLPSRLDPQIILDAMVK